MSLNMKKLTLVFVFAWSLVAFNQGRLLIAREPLPEDLKEHSSDSPTHDDLMRFMDASARHAKPTLLPILLRSEKSIDRLSRLSRADLYKYFMFDLRRMIREIETELAGSRLTRKELEMLDPNNFFDLQLSIEGLKTNLWNSRTDEVIYNDGETKVTRVYHDWYEIEKVGTTGKTEIIFMPDSILMNLDTGDGGQEMLPFPFSNSEEYSKVLESLLEIFGIDANSEAAQEMRDAAAKEAAAREKESDKTTNTKPASGDEGAQPETSEDTSLFEDFVDEAEKAWDLFVDMVDDAIDYGPDYVDPHDPIIKYTAGLHRLTDLYMEIKLAAFINGDRTPDPMNGVTSDDEWLRMMLVIAFYRPTPDSDPVDRPQREDLDIPFIDFHFDGAIDYGEDHWPTTVDPDDIPRGPTGL